MRYLAYVLGGILFIALLRAISPIIFLIAIIGLVIGLGSPGLVVKTKKASRRTRGMVVKWYGALAILAIVVGNLFGTFDMTQLEILFETNQKKETVNNSDITQESIDSSSIADYLEVHFIDVGQGDAILINYGDFEMLIDAGDNKYGTTVSDYLKELSIENIEYLVGTHMDADHIGGLDNVLNDFTVDHIIDSGTYKDTKTYRDYWGAVQNEVDTLGAVYQKDEDMTIVVDDDLTIKIIETGDDYKDENDNSIVVWLTYIDKDFLFTGDMEAHAEKSSLDKFGDIDVLKSGHHGSRTSSSETFLDITKPEVAIISCGQNNKYGHPHQETLDKYEDRGIEVYRTDLQGSIIVRVDQEGNMSFNTMK